MSELTETDVERIAREVVQEEREILRALIREEIRNAGHACRFTVPEAAVEEMGHAFGVARDLGQGDVSEGLETIRDNHKWLQSARKTSNKIGATLLIAFVTAIGGGLFTAVWVGFKHLAGKE